MSLQTTERKIARFLSSFMKWSHGLVSKTETENHNNINTYACIVVTQAG